MSRLNRVPRECSGSYLVRLLLAAACGVLQCAWPAAAIATEREAGAEAIYIGMSAPLTGSLSTYGVELERGLRQGFAETNARGGVGGRALELLVRDDGGLPERAKTNVQALVDRGVRVLTGLHGLASIQAVLPIVERSGVPLIGAASSAELLRDPPLPNVFNLRAGAREEAAAMVSQLDAVGLTAIAAITQQDALGEAANEGFRSELSRLAIRPLVMVRVKSDPDSESIAQAVHQACKERPQALMLGLDAANALAVIRAARKSGCTPQFYAMSEAGAQMLALTASVGEMAGVIVSQVVPHPRTASKPSVAEYQKAAGSTASYAGLEGYLYARVIADVLRGCSKEASRRCLITALESRPIDIGGYHLRFSPNDRRGSKFVEMTIITADGRFRR